MTPLLPPLLLLVLASGPLRTAAPAPIAPEKAVRILSARNLGLAQLEEGKNKEARTSFTRLSDLVPDEPLGWADAAIAALRAGDVSGAERLLEKARQVGGERADLYAIAAALEDARNRPEAVRSDLAKAASLDRRDLESRWRYVRSVEADPAPTSAARKEKQRFLGEILAVSPANLPARLKLLLLDMEAGDLAAVKRNLAELERLLADADPKTTQYLSESRGLLEKGDLKAASIKARILENVQRVTPRYLQSLGELTTNVVGLPLTSFSKELETALRPKGASGVPVTFQESARKVEDPEVTLRRVDLLNTGKAEVYAVPAPYKSAAFFDYDLDGDLDVYLSGGGKPDRLLRNNLDGTWTDVTGATGDPDFQSKKAIPGDFDRDGDVDLLVIDKNGDLAIRSNLRQGRFQTIPLGVSDVLDVATEDLNSDGALDIVAATSHGLVLLLNKGDGTFVRDAGGDLVQATEGTGFWSIALGDLDNDGLVDIVATGPKGLVLFRATGPGTFAPWQGALKAPVAADRVLPLDVDHDGDLDLVFTHAGVTSVLLNDGGNANGWLVVVVEGLPVGSGKVNRAGIGSVVEVKAGNLYAARTVGVLPTHFGLGTNSKAEVVRCVFTNGIPQNLFDQRARSVVKEVQQLKGSCPFVYAFDGASGRWTFITDALGQSPLGLLYDGVRLAPAVPREWLLIDGGLLAPTPDGRLLIDYTEELWEVTFLDEATLMAVDHPEGTAVVPNERSLPHAFPHRLYTVSNPRPVRAAFSEVGGEMEDVTRRLEMRDKVYVSPGPETAYQGIRKEHALLLDLGPLSPGDRVVLYLDGWLFYSDTSIQVSASQRKDVPRFPPLLEVADGKGGWKVAMDFFGFPSGKTKIMPVDLTGVVDPNDPRVRIRTTMAIYWDHAFVTVNDPEVPVVTTTLSPVRATLSERGFPRRYRETPDGPEIFDHDDVSPGPAWEDVPGLLTRLGDVTELLVKADDRWVAFQGGDAIRIEYDTARLPPLRKGWRRDYILVSDGWEKDFDKNTVTGQTVAPYPFHAMSSYPYPETECFPDEAFLREWVTRKVGPERFRSVVRDWSPPRTP
ncbi:MAG: FG-GAP-like repeat-containing protein [Thermoanaerobaculia bacterium]